MKRSVLVVLLLIAATSILALFNADFRHQLAETKDYVLYHNAHSKLGEQGRTDTLKIELSDSAFQVIADCRESAIERGLLGEENQNEVKAKLYWKGEKVKCKLRLKGDYPDHWSGDKWSFRINVKGQKSINGMDKFSIQDPATRKYMDEWYYQSLLEKEGLINLKYKFVHVEINGEYKGIYAMEESFSKELIEQNERRNGPILKFEESLWIAQILEEKTPQFTQEEIFETTKIKAFGMKKIKKDSLMNSYFNRGHFLLDGLRKGTLALDEVVDIEKAAMLFAIADLTGSNHGMRWHNQRFYYNPIIDKLEMIGFDSGSGVPIQDIYFNKWKYNKHTDNEGLLMWKDRFFISDPFRYEYFKALEKISSKSYLEDHNKYIDVQLKNNLYLMYKENTIYKFRTEIYAENAELIRKKLTPELIEKATFEQREFSLNKEKSFKEFNRLVKAGSIKVENKELYIDSDLRLTKTLIIPPNYQVNISPGVHITLADTSAFISYSSVTAIGTEAQPIIISSTDSSGSVFITGYSINQFDYVFIDHLNALKSSNLNYSGGINFFETKVHLQNCSISNSHSEDALNMINSYFEISHLKMNNIYSDALDSDFCTGKILNIELINIGNDGLDFSGSKAFIKTVYMSGTGDKGISAGEQSVLLVEDVTLEQCALGLVSKDYSYLKATNFVADSNQVVYLAFQKKREFGPAYVEVLNGNSSSYTELYLLEEKSRILIDQLEKTANVPSVINEIYGNKYGKSSK